MKPFLSLTAVYGVLIAALVAVTIWGMFDIGERFPVVLMAQAPVLAMRVVWKIARRIRRTRRRRT